MSSATEADAAAAACHGRLAIARRGWHSGAVAGVTGLSWARTVVRQGEDANIG